MGTFSQTPSYFQTQRALLKAEQYEMERQMAIAKARAMQNMAPTWPDKPEKPAPTIVNVRHVYDWRAAHTGIYLIWMIIIFKIMGNMGLF